MIRYIKRSVLALGICATLVLMQACGASDLHKINTTLDKGAAVMDGAAKTNHSFYESGVYGPVGSDGAIALRIKVATVIHDSDEKLIIAINLAKALTPATFEQGKLAILQTLAEAAANLHVGNIKIDLVLQSIATVINEAVVIISAFKSADLKYVLPTIKALQLKEVDVWAV